MIKQNNQQQLKHKKELNTSKRVVILTSIVILILLVWQAYSASKIHQSYQESLMDSITDRILSDYQEYFTQLRLEIDLFQQKQFNAIKQLQQQGSTANKDDYMAVLNQLRSDIKNTRLFALIDAQGEGSLAHITGNFLPDCEAEIASMLASGVQTQLFLHRSKSSIHFDLLQPLSTNLTEQNYLFVAFNPDVLIELLAKYQLPHQQLFLMRADNPREIELTTGHDNSKYASLLLQGDEYSSFSFVKPIPNTRWQLAIRLSPQYSSNLHQQGLLKAIVLWLALTLLIYGFYRQQKLGFKKHQKVKSALAFVDNHDRLTGLANRANFDRQLTEHINNKQPDNNSGVVMHIDLDKFQVINNSFGYGIGDKFLHKISLMLREFIPDNATVSRLGNDEFAILLPTLPREEVNTYAETLCLLVQKVRLDELKSESNVTASIGVIILDESVFDAKQVFSSLGQAVSLAKEKGRNRVQIYQSDDLQLVQHAKEMEAVHEVAEAIKADRLILYRQRLKSLQGEETDHFEILVRMRSACGNIVAPNEFIPAAEKYGMIRKIDYWVIENTFKKIASLPSEHSVYSINLSGLTLADKDIFAQISVLFSRYQIAPERICFEITETSAISHLASALHFIEQMIEFGCSFSLDDFGSGLSSFSYLQKLPVDTIKIDGVFVRDMDTNKVNRIFVENIKRTASAMHKKTVAEFVENADIERILTEIGIDYGQGYHIHKPEPWYESQQ
ncbi:putative bifunctional diguanylate cyclase/phosphodiesterase [Litorilituus sediminis]|uniref:EAL domain-containing protein n=1 Tax=Litorilituus sediminis TaxID=718192 RepID=A0A4P6P7I4_9GAMM|nr:EAL domain-containing protein [Litorilituus sediminis]QBG35462.1 EAL domain-containing protein [Litorilituus sediminis]